MRFSIYVQINPRELVGWVRAVAKDQIPFITAKALTMTAQGARTYVRAQMRQHMTIRRNWVTNQIGIEPARKADGLNRMHAKVGAKGKRKTWFLAEQLARKPSLRRPNKSRYLYVPKRARSSKRQTIPRTRRVAALMQNPRTVIIERIPGSPAVYLKHGRDGLRLMYVARKVQTVKPRKSLHDMVQPYVPVVLKQNFRTVAAQVYRGRR